MFSISSANGRWSQWPQKLWYTKLFKVVCQNHFLALQMVLLMQRCWGMNGKQNALSSTFYCEKEYYC